MIKKVIIFFIFFTYLSANNNIYINNMINNNGQIGENIDVYIVNNDLFDITIKYSAKTKNLLASDTFPIIKSIKSKDTIKITTFYILNSKYSLNSSYSWSIGNYSSKHNDNYLYKLPYLNGTKHMVSQGFNGYFSHKGNSLYAVDFAMKIGTKIYASRDGIVVKTKSDGYTHGDRSYIKEANFITIKHKDGTYGKYVHLKQNGVKVKVSQKVKRGQFIGLSGNTGYTNGPHLHFIVFKGKSYNSRQSIKIKFISKNGIIKEPIRGKSYTAVK